MRNCKNLFLQIFYNLKMNHLDVWYYKILIKGGELFKMPTINQLSRKPRKSKRLSTGSSALNRRFKSLRKRVTKVSSPHKRCVCTRVGTISPKKPNSALRKYARVRLSNNI